MRKRRILIVILIIAFLSSAWGNAIAAAFCPHYWSNRNCETKQQPRQPRQVNKEPSCHHELADMEMGDMQMDATATVAPKAEDKSIIGNSPTAIATEFSAEGAAINLPIEPCGHCWMHSQPASGTATLVAVDPSKQLIETIAPQADFALAVPPAFTVSIAPFEHGPPGNLLPRHVLINIFRI